MGEGIFISNELCNVNVEKVCTKSRAHVYVGDLGIRENPQKHHLPPLAVDEEQDLEFEMYDVAIFPLPLARRLLRRLRILEKTSSKAHSQCLEVDCVNQNYFTSVIDSESHVKAGIFQNTRHLKAI